MIERRSYAELGAAQHGWLNARHHFSFAGYHDAERMRWGRLRVWTTTASHRSQASSRTRTATWKSSPMCAKAPSLMKTAWVIVAAPLPVTFR